MPFFAIKKHLIVVIFVISFITTWCITWSIGTLFLNKMVIPTALAETEDSTKLQIKADKYIVIHLDTMTIDLNNKNKSIVTLPIMSKGRPGSYYETIGGSYINDYKTPLHLSSIGHVYMPYSVHVFGNYFIHGIPYYPNGETVSSTYSGGCIRLSNENAKIVYDFVEEGVPIIITKDGETFKQTKKDTSTFPSMEMTNLMIAIISLETLSQDDPIDDPITGKQTSRKSLLPQLLKNSDSSISKLYAKNTGEENYIYLMNKRAESLGLTNTVFTDLTSSAITSHDDYERFMSYVTRYKSYLLTIQ